MVDGIPLKKGDYVTCPWGAASPRDKYISDATEYHPERYLDEEEVKRCPKQINIPFGLGRRNCLGKELAWNEVMIYIGTLLNWYEVRQPKDYVRMIKQST